MLYNVKAKIFAKNLGKDFGRIVHTTVIANNEQDAIEQAEKSFGNLCATHKKNHNNIFLYTDLTVE